VRPGRGGRRSGSELGREASEPLGLALGAAAALVAWLLAVPAGVALLIGVATWAVRAAVAVLGGKGAAAAGGPAVVAVEWPGQDQRPGRAVAAWRPALLRCLAAVRAAGRAARERVERVVDRPMARLALGRLAPRRHDRTRARLRSQTAFEDPSPPAGIVGEVLEPVTLAVGLAAWGAAVVAGLPTVVAACIGGATVSIRAAVGALEQRVDPPGQRPASPIDQDSIEAQWLDRARRAAATCSDVALSVTSEPLAGQAEMTRQRLAETLTVLEGLAVRSSAARRALERTDVHALGAEAERLQAERAWASGEVAALLGRSLAAVEARMDLRGQLQTVRAGILARLEMGVVHLEHLAAQMAKLALSSVHGPAPVLAELDELFDRLAAVRSGLLAPADDARRAWEPGATAATS